MSDPWSARYPALSSAFFRGTLLGQIRSAYSACHVQPEQIADFKRAIEAGDVVLDVSKVLSRDVAKLVELGVDGPAELSTPTATPAASSRDKPAEEEPAGAIVFNARGRKH